MARLSPDSTDQTNKDVHEPVNRGNHRFRAVVVEFTKPPDAMDPPTSPGEPDPLDALIAAPEYHKLVLQNERVRVLEVRNHPGDFEPMHKHSRGVLVILQGGSARFGLSDGTAREATFSAPLTFWEDAENTFGREYQRHSDPPDSCGAEVERKRHPND